MTKLFAYNLEFEDHCDEMDVAGYTFTRLPDYASSLHKMHHNARIIHEFDVKPTTGMHVPTAKVVRPANEKRAVLPWATKRSALADVELLLSILTSREVFCLDALKPDGAIIRDPRQHRFGMSVRTAVKYERSQPDRYGRCYDIGFVNGINSIYRLVRSRQWQKSYQGGYVLFLAREAFVHQTLEKAFAQAWTLWEHVYAVLNPDGLQELQIYKVKSAKKIRFLLQHYGFAANLNGNHEEIINKHLARVRNRVVHFGRFKSERSAEDAALFVELNAKLVAKILGLTPKDVMCTDRRLRSLLRRSV